MFTKKTKNKNVSVKKTFYLVWTASITTAAMVLEDESSYTRICCYNEELIYNLLQSIMSDERNCCVRVMRGQVVNTYMISLRWIWTLSKKDYFRHRLYAHIHMWEYMHGGTRTNTHRDTDWHTHTHTHTHTHARTHARTAYARTQACTCKANINVP